MIKAGVIGWPISHSRSPLIHNYWLKQYGIAGSYERFAVEPHDLNIFIKTLATRGLAGCNVTIPHKQAALAAVDHIDEGVRSIGALNTIYVKDGATHATSTDGEGFYQNLLNTHPDFSCTHITVTILGAGGSAKAIIERLLRAHVKSINIVNRTEQRSLELCQIFGKKLVVSHPSDLSETLKSTDLVINTTSQGMTGQPTLAIDLTNLPAHAIVADIVYVPLKTELLRQAENLNLRVVGGLGMLLFQAVVGFEKWFGVKPNVTEDLYRIVASDIDPEFT
jgi:shikimate dehydrogenase